MAKYTIILDPAHGAETPGKRSPDEKLREYKWSRERVQELKQALELAGFEVFLTNNTDREIGLSRRAANANKISRKNKILLSLHSNAASNGGWSNARGYSVYTTKGRTNSDKVAEQILKDFKNNFPELQGRFDKSDGDLDIEENFTVIYKTAFPSVLIEWLFQDNKEDVKLLQNPEYNKRFVDSLVESLKQLDKTL